MKSLLLAGTAVLALAAAPAMAADLGQAYPVKAAPVAVVPVFSWTGFYLGANVGYAWSDVDANTFIDDNYSTGFSADGFIGGGQIGFNYQFENNVVVGVEADIEFGDVKDSLYLTEPFGADFDVASSVKTDYFGTVRARLGYAFDNVLPYVTGGFAWAHTKVNTTVYPEDGGSFSDSDENTHLGWVIGAGLEYAFAPNWTAKVEYLYSDLGSETYSGDFGDIYSSDVDLKIQTVKLGVNYKF